MKRELAIILFLLFVLTPFSSVSYADTKYTDPETGVSFTIPEGWQQRPFDKERESLKVQFATEDGALFQFGFMDMYADGLTAEERKTTKRADLTSDLLSAEIVSYIIDQPASSIRVVEYSNVEYYYFTEALMNRFMRLDNGYFFLFSYVVIDNGTAISKQRRNECEAIMCSVTYPGVQIGSNEDSGVFVTESPATNVPTTTANPFAAPSYTEDNTSYYLSDLDLRIVVPSGYYVLTRDTDPNDPFLINHEIPYDNLISVMESQDKYFDAISIDGITELIILAYESDAFSDLSNFNDALLDVVASKILDECSEQGYSISKYETYSHPQAKFIKVYGSFVKDGSNSTNSLQYTTICGGYYYLFILKSNSGSEISASQEKTIQSIVDSAQFGLVPAPTVIPTYAPTVIPTSAPKSTEAFVYSDEEGMVQFTVPDNWREVPLSGEREIIKTKFISDQAPGLTILYGYFDVWDSMSAAEKANQKRRDMDMSSFPISKYAKEYLDIPGDKVSTVTYNGQPYYKVEFPFEMIVLIHIANGRMYQFQLTGEPSYENYLEFEALLQSVKYEDLGDS